MTRLAEMLGCGLPEEWKDYSPRTALVYGFFQSLLYYTEGENTPRVLHPVPDWRPRTRLSGLLFGEMWLLWINLWGAVGILGYASLPLYCMPYAMLMPGLVPSWLAWVAWPLFVVQRVVIGCWGSHLYFMRNGRWPS
jgi:hypothetical protein